MSTIHGIDLGTHTTIVARLDETGTPSIITNAHGEQVTRSNLYLDPDGSTLIGTEAWHMGLADPSRYIKDAKRSIGSGAPVCTIDGTPRDAWEFFAIILNATAEVIEASEGQRPRDCVLTRPANWVARQKDELQRAAKEAGLDPILLPPEPTAAIFGAGAHTRGDGIVTVIDVGGGTTDVSVAEVQGNSVLVVATNGIAELGGTDFSALLEEWLYEQFEGQLGFRPEGNEHVILRQDGAQKVEHAKHMLSRAREARIVLQFDGKLFDATITRDEYAAMTRPLIQQVMNCAQQTLKDAGVSPQDIREFLLNGAQTQDPAFAGALQETFGRKPWAKSDPLFAVAKGAVVLGRLEMEKAGRQVQVGRRVLPPLNLSAHDVTAHAIGVATLDEQKRLVQSVIIKKGTATPSTRVEQFKLAEPGQVAAKIELLEGPDGAERDECHPLGHFDLTGLEAVYDREHLLEIELRLDQNAMLTATARDPVNGAAADLTIDYGTKSRGNEGSRGSRRDKAA